MQRGALGKVEIATSCDFQFLRSKPTFRAGCLRLGLLSSHISLMILLQGPWS